MIYGDYDNVTKDSKILSEILGRQGSSLLLEVIAEHVGKSSVLFSMSEVEVNKIKESLISELIEAINERT